MSLRAGVLSIAVLAATPVWAQSAEPAEKATGPRIEFTRQQLDLGGVNRGTEAVGRFEFRNVGDAELKLLKVDPG